MKIVCHPFTGGADIAFHVGVPGVVVSAEEQARWVPLPAERTRTLKEIFDSIQSRPRIILPKGITIRSLIEEGRR